MLGYVMDDGECDDSAICTNKDFFHQLFCSEVENGMRILEDEFADIAQCGWW